jgi:hypothetical protein
MKRAPVYRIPAPSTGPKLDRPEGAEMLNWIAAGRGLWVASRFSAIGLDHVGRVERHGDAYHAFDSRNRDLGAFSTLPVAQRRVETAPSRPVTPAVIEVPQR